MVIINFRDIPTTQRVEMFYPSLGAKINGALVQGLP